jgi:hypothetical protein
MGAGGCVLACRLELLSQLDGVHSRGLRSRVPSAEKVSITA